MINAIILTKNFYFVKNILENVEPDIFCRIMENLSEIKNGLIQNEIDLIFLDDELDNFIKESIFSSCKDFAICLNLEHDFKNGILKSNIKNKLNDLLKIHQQGVIRNRILLELQYLGYNISHQGTYFLLDAIIETINRKDAINNNLTTEIFPIIAKKYHKTAENVKSSINKATNQMYYECDINKIKKYFYFYENTKPTVKQIVFSVANRFVKI